MAKIFTKLYIGDTVATSGTRVFKKLSTEEPASSLPVWNGTDLKGTTWYIPAGWTAEAGYGVFYVEGTAEFEDYVLSTSFTRLYIGYDTESTVSDGYDFPAPNTILVRALGYQKRGNTDVQAFRFVGGQDTTNPLLINWLLENGRLTSHRLQAGLYDANNNLLASLDELVNTYGMAHSSYEGRETNSAAYIFSNYSELAGGTKLIIDGSIYENTLGANGTFWGCTNLQTVVLLDGIEKLITNMFRGCTNLANINIPDSVTIIGGSVVAGCLALKHIAIPPSVTALEALSLNYCGIVDISIPDSVTKICSYALSDCLDLATITIPISVTEIDNRAFRNCTSITDVYYRGTEEQWNAITIGDGNEYITNATIHYNYTG